MSQQPPQPPAPPGGGFGQNPGYPQAGPMYPQAPQPAKSGMGTGAIIAIVVGVVALVLVAIIGIFAVLGIYGTRKYIANAKTAEAKNSLGQISKDAAAAYENETMDSTTLSAGANTTVQHRLCPSATNTVPVSIGMVSGKKYQSTHSEWADDKGWSCLRFEMSSPQYYQYHYASTPDSFTAKAMGDLDGDMIPSEFEIEGRVQDNMLRVSPVLKETNPDE